jgi:YVTN family beta-propeller protein
MEDELRAMLQRKADGVPALAAVAPGTIRRARRRAALTIGVAVVLAVALGVGTFVGVKEITVNRTITPPVPAQTPRIASTIHLTTHPTSIAADGGVVWVVNSDDGSLQRIDPRTNRPAGSQILCSMKHLVLADDALWTLGDNSNLCLPGGARKPLSVFRLDPATGAVIDEIPIQADERLVLRHLAAGEGAVWVAQWSEPGTGDIGPNLPGVLTRVDPASGRATGSIRLGMWVGSLAVGDGAVWVADGPYRSRGVLSRVDPSSMRVVARIDVGRVPLDATVAFGSVWVTNSADGTIMRIDPETNRVEATISVPGGAGWVTAGGGAVWTADSGTGTVSWIDPGTNQVAGSLRIGRNPDLVGMAAGDGAIWVTDAGDQTVTRIDLSRP